MQSLSAFKSPGERVFLFSWERLGWSLWETFVSRKAVPEVLDVKYRSEVKHGYTNRGYLHCVILNLYIVLRKIEPIRQEICKFYFKMFKMRFSRF